MDYIRSFDIEMKMKALVVVITVWEEMHRL